VDELVVVMVFVADQGQDCTNTGTTISFRQHQEQSIERWALASHRLPLPFDFEEARSCPKSPGAALVYPKAPGCLFRMGRHSEAGCLLLACSSFLAPPLLCNDDNEAGTWRATLSS
jgi:hypothetical protein